MQKHSSHRSVAVTFPLQTKLPGRVTPWRSDCDYSWGLHAGNGIFGNIGPNNQWGLRAYLRFSATTVSLDVELDPGLLFR